MQEHIQSTLNSIPWQVSVQFFHGSILLFITHYLTSGKRGKGHFVAYLLVPACLLLVGLSGASLIGTACLFSILCGMLIIRRLRRYHRFAFATLANAEDLRLWWLYALTGLVMMVATLQLLVAFTPPLTAWQPAMVDFSAYLACAVILAAGIRGMLFQPNINRLGVAAYESSMTPLAINHEQRRHAKILYKRLEKTLTVEQLYRQPDLCVQQLAQVIGCDPLTLEHAIVQEAGLNFCDYINFHRVAVIRGELEKQKVTPQQLFAKAQQNGFTSRMTFQSVFRRFAGHRPQTLLSRAP